MRTFSVTMAPSAASAIAPVDQPGGQVEEEVEDAGLLAFGPADEARKQSADLRTDAAEIGDLPEEGVEDIGPHRQTLFAIGLGHPQL
jgi:hypothetical protein